MKIEELSQNWVICEIDSKEAIGRKDELLKEISKDHLLYGKEIEVIAYRKGNDDILCKVVNENKFYVVHLTWIGKIEEDPFFPFIKFSGNYDEFLEKFSQ